MSCMHTRLAAQEVKHLGGYPAVETWDSILVSAHTLKQLLIFPCPNVPATKKLLEQCFCYLMQLLVGNAP